MDNLKIIESFEEAIDEIEEKFKHNYENFFFTEKELHSYFYHICLSKELTHNRYNLVHAEYPTPFKCSIQKEYPYIKKVEDDSDNQRARVDLVLLNPNYIDFALEFAQNDKRAEHSIFGLYNKDFTLFIEDFRKLYDKFADKYNESILLYSLEFKYFRHTSNGGKSSKQKVERDLQKLELLEDYKIGSNKNTPFSKNNKSLVFIGARMSKNTTESIENIENNKKLKVIPYKNLPK